MFWYRVLAEFIVVFHIGTIFFLWFGWIHPGLFWFWGAAIWATLISWLTIDRCVIVDWEVYFRKKANMPIKYKNNFLGYWGEKILGSQNLSDKFIKQCGYVFIIVSLVCWSSYFFHDLIAVYTI